MHKGAGRYYHLASCIEQNRSCSSSNGHHSNYARGIFPRDIGNASRCASLLFGKGYLPDIVWGPDRIWKLVIPFYAASIFSLNFRPIKPLFCSKRVEN